MQPKSAVQGRRVIVYAFPQWESKISRDFTSREQAQEAQEENTNCTVGVTPPFSEDGRLLEELLIYLPYSDQHPNPRRMAC